MQKNNNPAPSYLPYARKAQKINADIEDSLMAIVHAYPFATIEDVRLVRHQVRVLSDVIDILLAMRIKEA